MSSKHRTGSSSHKPDRQGSSRSRLLEAAKSLFAKHGFEATSTAEICRLAGTSPSQLVSHFGSKTGLLEAIFEAAWSRINPAVHLAAVNIQSPQDKLRLVGDMVFRFLANDPELLTIFLLEARRIRGDGREVSLVPSFLEFVHTLDEILKKMADDGELLPGVHPQAMRSALMGAFEGLVRDRLLVKYSNFPATYSDAELQTVFNCTLLACLCNPRR